MGVKNRYSILLIMVSLIVGWIFYAKTYDISEENIKPIIAKKLDILEENIEITKETNLNNIKALIFSNTEGISTFGLAIFEKGMSNKYRISGIYTDNKRYTIVKRYLTKLSMVEAGDNRDGKLSYIKFEDNKKEIIQLEKDLFVKIFNIEHGQVYNYYNDNDEIVELD